MSRLRLAVPLSPPDTQLLAALLPRIEALREHMVSRLTGEARNPSTTAETLWRFAGGLIALSDLETSLKSELTRASKDLSE